MKDFKVCSGRDHRVASTSSFSRSSLQWTHVGRREITEEQEISLKIYDRDLESFSQLCSLDLLPLVIARRELRINFSWEFSKETWRIWNWFHFSLLVIAEPASHKGTICEGLRIGSEVTYSIIHRAVSVTLWDKVDFADVIKISRWGDYRGLPGWVWNAISHFLTRWSQGKTQ